MKIWIDAHRGEQVSVGSEDQDCMIVLEIDDVVEIIRAMFGVEDFTVDHLIDAIRAAERG